MRKMLQTKLMLLMALVLMGAGNVWATETVTWEKTAPTALATGDVVVIVDQTSVKAMSNDNGTSSAPSATAVTLNADKSQITSEVAATLQWTVTVTTSDTGRSYQFAKGIDYLYCTNTNNGVRVGSNENNAFTITQGGDNNADYLVNTATSRYIGVYNNQDWRCYTSINNNIKGNVTAFYKKVVTSDLTPVATIGDLTPSELKAGKMGEFTLSITPAEGLTEGTGYSVSWASSNEDVLELAGETYEAKAAGTATVTVTVTPTDNTTYSTVSKSFEVIVTANADVDPVSPAGSSGKYVKVTSTSDITSGQYLIVYEDGSVAFDGSLETLDAVSNTISVEIENGEIAATAATQTAKFTIDVTAGTLQSASGLYIGVTSNSNGLKTSDDASSYSNSFSYDTDNSCAVIAANYEGSTMSLRYNYASDNLRFRYYKNSGQQAIQLYKYVPGTPSTSMTVTLSDQGYKTLVSTEPFSTPAGTTAYIVTAASASEITMTAVAVVPADEPVILKGDADAEVELTVEDATDATDCSENLLQVSTASTGDGVYVLANGGHGVAFYRWDGGSLGAGRVYLPAASVPSAARQWLTFAFGDATGIGAALNDNGETINETVYDLQGRRVAQPVKGLYIVNGRKRALR